MKKLLLIFALTLGCVFGAESALPPALLAEFKKPWPKNRIINLVFHGHSVPSGYHKTPEVKPFESYPHLVHQLLKKQYPFAVINIILTSIGGENSLNGAPRFERDVLTHMPDVIFIDYALNDRGKPPQKVEAAWRSMIQAAKKQNIPVILITPTGDSRADISSPQDPLCQQAELIRSLAETENVLLADVFAAWKAELAKGTPQTDLLSQVNHPNLRGHTLVAEVIASPFLK
ncbi:MAG: SGNH/GDSL hydrolase family protein [Akkermansiaceae bacterium]